MFSGGEVFAAAFRLTDPLDRRASSSWRTAPSSAAATSSRSSRGPARAVLTAERIGLELRAAHVRASRRSPHGYVAEVAAHRRAHRGHRKTTPGLRAFERHAVRDGGGRNHRYSLSDAVMAKDNHLAVLAQKGVSVTEALARREPHCPTPTHIEVEVDRLDQIEPVLAAGIGTIMLDNFSSTDLRDGGARQVAGRAVVEAIRRRLARDRCARSPRPGSTSSRSARSPTPHGRWTSGWTSGSTRLRRLSRALPRQRRDDPGAPGGARGDDAVPHAVSSAIRRATTRSARRPPDALADARSAQVARILGLRAGDVVFTSGGTEADNLAVKGIAHRRGARARRAPRRDDSRSSTRRCSSRADYLARLHGFDGDRSCLSTLTDVWAGCRRRGAARRHGAGERSGTRTTRSAPCRTSPRSPRVARERGSARSTSTPCRPAGWLACRLRALGVDALSIAGHKLGAPKGTGALGIRGRIRSSRSSTAADRNAGAAAAPRTSPARWAWRRRSAARRGGAAPNRPPRRRTA